MYYNYSSFIIHSFIIILQYKMNSRCFSMNNTAAVFSPASAPFQSSVTSLEKFVARNVI